MDNMQHAEELVREFLVFRGFTNTLKAFENELSSDIGSRFQVDKIIELIFSIYIPEFQAEKLVSLLKFFKHCFSSSDTILTTTLSKLEVSILRYYIVYSIKSGRRDKVMDFFGLHGDYLLQRGQDWISWFSIPYLKNPSLDPQFRLYFSQEWSDALHLAIQNFLSEIFNGSRIPEMLKISSEKNTVNRLKQDIKQLNLKLSQFQSLLEEKEALIRTSRSYDSMMMEKDFSQNNLAPSPSGTIMNIESPRPLQVSNESCIPSTSSGGRESSKKCGATASSDVSSKLSDQNLIPSMELPVRSSFQRGSDFESDRKILGEEEFPEVKAKFQETFLGHTSPISRCRFSMSGDNIASASVDGTVRIWTYDSLTPSSRNATIYCGAEIMSLDWECKSDRLLLIGTACGGIKAWNVDAKRVVCDLSTNEAFPSVLDLKCSPIEPIFVSAAASRGDLSGNFESLGFASLVVWNMKTWKPVSVLPLGDDPPAITSLCFNHNGKILAASAADGMIHMFDMSAGLQITGWPAHDSTISSVLFGSDETSIFSLGSEGKVVEWSLQNQGQVIWSRNWNSFGNRERYKPWEHEMALDASGGKILVASGSVSSPIYQVRGVMDGLKSLPHSAAVTTVDWHPTLPIFLTGSADHSVRVTSML